MSDDTFQLTPHDVRAQEFQKVLRGFDPVQVEDFKTRMAEELDRLLRHRVGTDERLKGMMEQLKSFRERERALNDGVVMAQQLRADSQASAERESEVILKEARQEASSIVEEARREGARLVEQSRAEDARLRAAMDASVRQYSAYLTSYRSLLERQLADLAALEQQRDRSDTGA
jgi:DivIVA domain-containing protein